MIPYGRQDITDEDIQAVIEVLESDFLTQGPVVPAFERKIASYTSSQHAVAVNSATSALHIACLALGLGKGDWLWTSPISFVASANCGLYCGAQVDFIDIDLQTYNINTETLEEKLIEAELKGKLPKVVIPVHLCGHSCDMQAIHKLAKRFGFSIIEDASHAIGGSYLSNKLGSCEYSDITVFSFHPVKIITTGEGGMLTTNSSELNYKLRLLRSHGVSREDFTHKSDTDGDWYYEQSLLGFNYRLTDLQSALGISQLKRIDSFIAARTKLASHYTESLNRLPIILPTQMSYAASAWHLYVIQIDTDLTKARREDVYKKMKAAGIGVNVHYIPIHTQPYYRRLGFKQGDFPYAEQYYSKALTLPLYPSLTQQEYVIETLKAALA
ncbi:MAG: UDP-4-amino-4,6-dideoxy-N-acetyl-beta-L-altrosamine transaminase [Gammaproteobacteria bacterium]|nr:UDP-4-amino-4,6-dideoxy-N-acetyl-beta-L-altrosamine transaminase [Gammaproteobacteria bacterium]